MKSLFFARTFALVAGWGLVGSISHADLFTYREHAYNAAVEAAADQAVMREKQVIRDNIYSQVYWNLAQPNGGLSSFDTRGDIRFFGNIFIVYGISFSTGNGLACRQDIYNYSCNLTDCGPLPALSSSSGSYILCFDQQNRRFQMDAHGQLTAL